MTSKKVTRYYCDFCRKGSFTAKRMKEHEASCTLNPNRVCSLCAEYNQESTPLAELMAICDTFPARAEEQKSHLNDLRDAAEGCPVCMMAAMRQCNAKKVDEVWFDFDFKEEMREFRKETEVPPIGW